MSLRIYNTLTRQKEPFVPLAAGRVSLYVCGVTPYDVSHIGHARSALVFDVIARYLRYRRYKVTFVKNYTDVDDKIIGRANQLGISTEELADRYIKSYQDDMAKLGVEPPTEEPRATRHIPEMVALIVRLIEAGVAYVVDGDVYFEVGRFPTYGRLSGKNLDELLAGARVDVNERKRDPRDFALWKAAKPGEPSWASPWGPGRPGWHIECSAMAMKYLGESLDLHGGGQDLVFPHHSCEIAQSEAATGKPFARFWLHNGFVNLGAEKMSKSLGNTLTIEALLKRHDPEALRLYLLQTHYRNPVEFSEEGVAGMRRPLERFRQLVAEATRLGAREPEQSPDGAFLGTVAAHRERFEAAMDDDFNTPQAIGVLNQLRAILDEEHRRVVIGIVGTHGFVAGVGVFTELGRHGLGLAMRPARSGSAAMPYGEPSGAEGVAGIWAANIAALVQERDEERAARNWKRADELRKQIEAEGAVVEDAPTGPSKWKPRSAPTGP